MNLQDKVIAITGAGQGLGRAMSVFLAEKGARIAVIDLNQEQMDETKRLIEEVGGSAETFVCNVADEAQVESTFTSIPVKLGPLFGLVNNAGILRDGLMVRQKDGEISKLSLSH